MPCSLIGTPVTLTGPSFACCVVTIISLWRICGSRAASGISLTGAASMSAAISRASSSSREKSRQRAPRTRSSVVLVLAAAARCRKARIVGPLHVEALAQVAEELFRRAGEDQRLPSLHVIDARRREVLAAVAGARR